METPEYLEKALNSIKFFMLEYYNEHHSGIYSLSITDLQVRSDHSGGLIVDISLVRPGLFIGKAGRDIDALTVKLCGFIGKPLVFHIIEINPFKIDYDNML
jgi:ribosomal protein S3